MSDKSEGLLLVDKPLDWTSFEVIRQVRRLAKLRKVGHAGTLDPKATGLLAVALGRCTKLIRYLDLDDKTYLFTLRLGETTETLDTEGEVVATEDWKHIERVELEERLDEFTGCIQQVPPAYSAVKIDGKRAHELARAGEEVELEPRQIEIHDLELIDWEPPDVKLRVRCGSGTYVRSLARDLAEAVGTVGYTTSIRRTEAGGFSTDDAVEIDDVDEDNIRSYLLSPLEMLQNLPSYRADESQREDIGHGRPFRVKGEWPVGTYVAGHDDEGRLLAVLECTDCGEGECQLWPRRVMMGS